MVNLRCLSSRRTSDLFLLLLFAWLYFCIGTSTARAHNDNTSAEIGRYKVTLDSLFIDAGSASQVVDLNPGEPVILLVHTTVVAQTHLPAQESLFLLHGRVATDELVNRVIYSHLDCTPGENISVVIEIGLLDQADVKIMQQPLKGLLKSGGIVTPLDNSKAAARSHGAIKAQFAKLNRKHRFPIYNSADFDGGPFIFGANEGSVQVDEIVNELNGGTPYFNANLTFTYTPQTGSECRDTNAFSTAAKAMIAEDLIQGVLDSDGDGYSNGEEKACRSKTNDQSSIPNYSKGTCLGPKTVKARKYRHSGAKEGSATFPCPDATYQTLDFFIDVYFPTYAQFPKFTLSPDPLCPDVVVTVTDDLIKGNPEGKKDELGKEKNTFHVQVRLQYVGQSSESGSPTTATVAVTWD